MPPSHGSVILIVVAFMGVAVVDSVVRARAAAKAKPSGLEGDDALVYKAYEAYRDQRYEAALDLVRRHTEYEGGPDKVSSQALGLLVLAIGKVISPHLIRWREAHTLEVGSDQLPLWRQMPAAQIRIDEAQAGQVSKALLAHSKAVLEEYCNYVLDELLADETGALREKIASSGSAAQQKVHFLYLKARYSGHLVELQRQEESDSEERAYFVDRALRSFEAAREEAESLLPPTHELRLAVAAAHACFYKQVLDPTRDALHFAFAGMKEPHLEISASALESIGEGKLGNGLSVEQHRILSRISTESA